MKHKIMNQDERICDLISRAFGLEMIRSILEYSLNEGEARKEAEGINREINHINRRIRKLMESEISNKYK